MKMLSEPCWGCPFSAKSLVAPARVREITASLREKDTHFECHKASDEIGVERLKGVDLMCRGYYDTLFAKERVGNLTRILERLNGFEIVRLSPQEKREAKARIRLYGEAVKRGGLGDSGGDVGAHRKGD